MRNEALQQLGGLIGNWTLTMAHAWFLDDPDATHDACSQALSRARRPADHARDHRVAMTALLLKGTRVVRLL